MTEGERFAVLAQAGRFTVGEMCRDFGISRKQGKFWKITEKIFAEELRR